MRQLTTATILGLLALSPIAHAQTTGRGASPWYVGAGAGQVSIEGAGGSAAGYKLFVGADFNRFLGMEVGYINAGSESLSEYDPYTGISAYASGSTNAAQLSLIGKLPLGQYFDLFGRVDGIYWSQNASAVAYDSYGDSAGLTVTQTGTSFGWGAGGEATFGHFGVRAEFEQSNIDSNTYRLVSGSFIYHF